MAPHAARLTSCFTGFSHFQINRGAVVFVGLDGHRFDAVSPALEGRLIEVAGAVIRVNASSMEDFRTQVISEPSKTPLVKHEGSRFLSMDGFGLQVGQQVAL
jgi:hypothetical protein